MNTKQLVVIWYAGLAIAGALLLWAGERPRWPLLVNIFCILMITGLFLYTFRTLPAVNKRRLFFAVAVPVAAVIGPLMLGQFYDGSRHSQSTQIPTTEIDLFEATLQPLTYPGGNFSGRVLNKSDHAVSMVVLQIRVLESDQPVDGAQKTVIFNPPISPGDARSFFNEYVTGLRFPEKWAWDFEIIAVK